MARARSGAKWLTRRFVRWDGVVCVAREGCARKKDTVRPSTVGCWGRLLPQQKRQLKFEGAILMVVPSRTEMRAGGTIFRL